jgi:hypothetical protein
MLIVDLGGNVSGELTSSVPVTVTDKLDDVVFDNVQNAPACTAVRVGIVNALNPVFVTRKNVEKKLEERARDVPVAFDVIQRVSVGA